MNSSSFIASSESITSYCSTMFADFKLKSQAVYNFYTENETIDENQQFINNDINSLPRYIKLNWQIINENNIELTERQFKNIEKIVKKDFTIEFANNSTVNGFISPGIINCLVTSPAYINFQEFDENAFLNSNLENNSYFLDHKNKFKITKKDEINNSLRVDFIDPSITGLLDDNRVSVSQQDIHLINTGAISKICKNLEVISELNQDSEIQNKIPSFEIKNSQQKKILYIGYVLEKFAIETNGSFHFIERFFIDTPIGEFIDYKVAFGKKYAYRIKCIVQWTRNKSIDFNKVSFDRNLSIDENNPNILIASFYSCEWSDWSTATIVDNVLPNCPDEFTVIPLNKKNILSWKMPHNSQSDLNKMRVLKSVIKNGECTDWVQIYECNARNGIFIDKNVSFFEESNESYMYAMYSTSLHNEFSFITNKIIVKLSKINSNSSVNAIYSDNISPSSIASIETKNDNSEIEFTKNINFTCKNSIYKNRLNIKTYCVYVQSLLTSEIKKNYISIRTADI